MLASSASAVESSVGDYLDVADDRPLAPGLQEKPSARRLVPFHQLFRFATKSQLLKIIAALASAVIHGLAMPLFAFVFGDLVDVLGAGDADFVDEVSKRCLHMVYIGLGALVFAFVWHSILTSTSHSQATTMRVRYFEAVLSRDVAWFDKVSPAELPTRITEDVAKVQNAIGFKLGVCLVNSSMFIFGYAMAFVRGWEVSLIATASMPIVIGASAVLGYAMAQSANESQSWYARAGAVAEEVLSSIRTVTMMGTQRREIERYASKLEEARKGGTKLGLQSGLGLGLTYGAVYGAYAITFWYGGTLVRDAVINDFTGKPYTGGDVLSVFFSLIMGTFGLGQALPPLQAFQIGRAAATDIHEAIDEASDTIEQPIPAESPDGHPVIDYGVPKMESIQLENVFFAYPSRPEIQVLKGVSLEIKIGMKVAFVGESGSGKSMYEYAVLSVMAYPSIVLLNGEDIREIDGSPQSIRSIFGYVGQEPILFAASIKENLTYGLPYTPTDEEIKSACKRANVHSFISSLPDGYNTYCGSSSGGGSQISGGQKQRVAIARALLRNPQILLLDEATSALDNESELMVQETIDELQKTTGLTTISIAHRLSTIRNSDVIFVLQAGSLVEQGTHEELLRNPGGRYSNLIAAQQVNVGERRKSDPRPSLQRQESDPADPKAVELIKPQVTMKAEKTEREIERARIEKIAKNYRVPWGRILRLSKPEWSYYIPALFGAIISGCIMPFNAFVLSRALKAFYNKDVDDMMNGVSLASIGFVILATAALVGGILQTGAFSFIGEHLTKRIRRLCFTKFLEQDMAFFDDPNHSSGRLTAALSTYALKMNSISGVQLGAYCQFVASLVSGLIISFLGSWKLSLVMVAVLPLMAGAGAIQMAAGLGMDKNKTSDSLAANQIASDAVQNIRTIRALVSEQWTRNTFADLQRHASPRQIRASLWAGFWYGVSQGVLMFFSIALGMWYGATLVEDDGLQFHEMIQSLMGVFLAAMAAGQALAFLGDVKEAKAAAHDVFKLLDSESTINPSSNLGRRSSIWGPQGTKSPEAIGITFKDVEFSYPQRPDAQILQGLSFRIEPGQTVALVGPSGGGKSTVFALLQRFYDPTGGSILVEESDTKLDDMNVAWWREQIGFVSQEPVLFDLTLEENVRYGAPPIERPEMLSICARAGMNDFAGSKVAWDVGLGPRGGLLSGGQKQRVAIARALMRHPRLLLLDEATSALDSASEAVVQKALDDLAISSRSRQQSKPTTLIIAHRLSTVHDADLILVIAGGRLVEQGTHTELIEKEGVYYDLHQKGNL
ncbi:(ABC) transporter [Perkinsus chesapeaki]|uniref:(ABC) transporter n=1 Tax=Perkinsus chesapeaki TaxID=330153 RepID=A0A7J6M5A1_PERCH|nr:(ABC) transporter [Perkinsus chesapeaki]